MSARRNYSRVETKLWHLKKWNGGCPVALHFFFSQYFSQQVTVPTCSPCPLEVVLGMKKDLHSYPGLDGKDKINSHALNGRKVQKKRERKCTLNYSL